MVNSSNNDLKLNRPIIINFKTNAKIFKVNFELSNIISGNFPHVGVTAREGIAVLYRRLNEKNYYNMDVMSRHKSFTLDFREILPDDDFFEVLIYGPILSQLEYFDIELSHNFRIEVIKRDSCKNILIGGGLHSFGIGCTTSGVMFPNIIGRKFNSNIINISQYDSNFLKVLYDTYKDIDLPKCDLGILELDYFNQNEKILDEYLINVVNLFKSKCDKLICWYTLPPDDSYRKNHIHDLLNQNFNKNELIIKDLSCLYNKEYLNKCTFSKNFINDTANICIFKELSKIIGEL